MCHLSWDCKSHVQFSNNFWYATVIEKIMFSVESQVHLHVETLFRGILSGTKCKKMKEVGLGRWRIRCFLEQRLQLIPGIPGVQGLSGLSQFEAKILHLFSPLSTSYWIRLLLREGSYLWPSPGNLWDWNSAMSLCAMSLHAANSLGRWNTGCCGTEGELRLTQHVPYYENSRSLYSWGWFQ